VWAGNSGSIIELDRLDGPRTGRVELPHHLFPDAPQRVVLDLDEPGHKARVYTACLLRGSPYDVYRYVNLADLADLLPTLSLPSTLAEAWRHALHDARHANAGAAHRLFRRDSG
jgi:hypothetical protein